MAEPGETGGLVIAGVILAVVGLGFSVASAHGVYERWQLRTRFIAVAKEASALVVDVRLSSSGGSGRVTSRSYSHIPRVQFVDGNGRPWSVEMSTQTGKVYGKGDRLTLLYEPANPQNAWDAPPSLRAPLISLGVSAFFMLLGGGLVLLFGRNRKPND